MHDVVDLRSDTVTLPTPAMRRAMADAEVGDDVFGEDPTVLRLERRAAELTGLQAGLFMASGTQGNLVSILTQTRPGQEIVVDADSHVFNSEAASAAVFGGVQSRAVPTARGFFTVEQVCAAIRPRQSAISTALVCLENTHNLHGGTCCTPEDIEAVSKIARDAGVRVHLDGARIFNAGIALKRPLVDFTRHVDSITFCLSKGLGAPAGSVVCGSRDLIDRARQVRRMLGGGMRQIGILAAAGLVALDTMVDRLVEDHDNCRRLAEGLARLPGIALDLETVQTNIVVFRPERESAVPEIIERCQARGVRMYPIAPGAIRCVTHKDVDREDVERALEVVEEVTRACKR